LRPRSAKEDRAKRGPEREGSEELRTPTDQDGGIALGRGVGAVLPGPVGDVNEAERLASGERGDSRSGLYVDHAVEHDNGVRSRPVGTEVGAA